MNYQILKEVTNWGDYNVPNHTYILGLNGKCLAYAKNHTELTVFDKPLTFTKTRRKFETKKVKDYLKYFENKS